MVTELVAPTAGLETSALIAEDRQGAWRVRLATAECPLQLSSFARRAVPEKRQSG